MRQPLTDLPDLSTYKTLTNHSMQSQATSRILMIRPVNFGFNTETADSNAFQDIKLAEQTKDIAQEDAQREFDEMARQLQALGVDVLVYEDTAEPYTPDSIFPNNWVSFHASGTVVLYPMQAENRRLERRQDIIDDLAKRYHVAKVVDLTHFEQEGKFLEGTGSLVLDRMNRVAFAQPVAPNAPRCAGRVQQADQLPCRIVPLSRCSWQSYLSYQCAHVHCRYLCGSMPGGHQRPRRAAHGTAGTGKAE